jgi:hypothetical protein
MWRTSDDKIQRLAREKFDVNDNASSMGRWQVGDCSPPFSQYGAADND